MDDDDSAGHTDRSTGGDVLASVVARWRSDATFAVELANDRNAALAPFDLTTDERLRIGQLIDGEVTYGRLFGSPDAAPVPGPQGLKAKTGPMKDVHAER